MAAEDKEVLIDEKGNIVADAPPPADEQNEDEDDDKKLVKEEGHEDEDEDEAGAKAQEPAGENDEEREAIRERRRQERAQKKQAQREREDRLRRELQAERAAREQLENRLNVVERKASGMEISTLDSHIKQAGEAYNYFKNQIAVASASGDHAAMSDAIEKMTQARDRAMELDRIKKGYSRQQQQPAPLDPVIASHAQDWMERNPWYDPDRKDQDSDLTATLDERLAREGWNPKTKEYWDELDARLKKYLPHRAKPGYNNGQALAPNTPRPRAPVGGSGREGAGGSGGGTTYRLSAERVAALKEAGIEPGTEDFVKAVKRYHDYDKQAKSN